MDDRGAAPHMDDRGAAPHGEARMSNPNVAVHRTLIDRLVGRRADDLAVKIGLAVAGSLLLAVSAQLKVNFGPVPFTFQTLVLLLIAATYGRNLAVGTVLLYLAEGAAGLPVFANGVGPAVLVGPTAGFLAGFVVCAAIVGEAADRGLDRSPVTLAPAMLAGIAVLFAMGWAWLAFGFGLGAEKAWLGGVQPFVLGDLIKIAIAALAVPAGMKLLGGR